MNDDTKTDAKATKGAEAANERVQDAMDDETEKGFRGETSDPTPDEHYTIAGVTSGKPTPENNEARSTNRVGQPGVGAKE